MGATAGYMLREVIKYGMGGGSSRHSCGSLLHSDSGILKNADTKKPNRINQLGYIDGGGGGI
jgi:hypothetical protein